MTSASTGGGLTFWRDFFLGIGMSSGGKPTSEKIYTTFNYSYIGFCAQNVERFLKYEPDSIDEFRRMTELLLPASGATSGKISAAEVDVIGALTGNAFEIASL